MDHSNLFSLWGNVCPARYFSINYPYFSPYITPTFSRVPNKGDKFKSGYIAPGLEK